MADCEGGSKYFGLRGIKVDVAQIEKWSDMKDFLDHARKEKYETVIIDPIGELMGKLKRFMISQGDRKLVQSDGTPSIAGWGWLKETMRAYLKAVRDSGMHVLLVAHVDPVKDGDVTLLWPLLETKLREELVNMMDVVGYMTVIRDEGESKRVIFVDPDTGKFKAKDRTGQLGKVIEPNFSKIIEACQGTASYAWMKPTAKKPEEEVKTAPVEETEKQEKVRKAKEESTKKLNEMKTEPVV